MASWCPRICRNNLRGLGKPERVYIEDAAAHYAPTVAEPQYPRISFYLAPPGQHRKSRDERHYSKGGCACHHPWPREMRRLAEVRSNRFRRICGQGHIVLVDRDVTRPSAKTIAFSSSSFQSNCCSRRAAEGNHSLNTIAGQGAAGSLHGNETSHSWAGFNNYCAQSPGRSEIDRYYPIFAHHKFNRAVFSIHYSIDITGPSFELVSFSWDSSQCDHCIVVIGRSAAELGIVCHATPALGIADDRQRPGPSSAGSRRGCQRYHDSGKRQQNQQQNKWARLSGPCHFSVS